jgi:hypothetical protein
MYEANLYYRNNFRTNGIRSNKKRKFSIFSSNKRENVVHITGNGFSGGVRRRPGSGLMNTGKLIAGGALFGAYSGVKGVTSTLKDSTLLFASAYRAATKIKSGTMKLIVKPSMIITGLILVAISLSLIQLAHYNHVATKGYELRRLEADRQQLMGQYEVKNMKLAEAKALNTISLSDRVSVMRRPYQVSYVRGNTALAQLP